jgi:hypothetical protein
MLLVINDALFHTLLARPFDYSRYEIDASYDRFGFRYPYNRFQILSPEVMDPPAPHIRTIQLSYDGSALDTALGIARAFIAGYNEKQQLDRSDRIYETLDLLNNFNRSKS